MDIKNGNEKLINNKPKLLLHSCCGPCSTSVIERLVENYDITVFYFNPNIFPYEEYLKRLNEQKRLLKILNIPFIEGEYNQEIFNNALIGCENQKEGELRCYKCYELRLKHTFEKALELNFDYYTTIYAKVKGAEELETNKKEYEDLIEQAKNKIEEIKTRKRRCKIQ